MALLGLGRVLARSFFGYGNVEIFRWLKSRGIRISVLAPDAEVFSGIETLAEFFDLDDSGGSHRAKVDQVLSEPGTHISMSGNTSALAEALRVVQAL